MCGILCIFGIVGGADAKRQLALQCLQTIRHRGPDWTGIYVDDENILGHERLAIMDPDSGEQPLYNARKTLVLCVNGEIYNHKELRSELVQPHPHEPFKTKSDCEVLLHLYQLYGTTFVSKLNGIFSFVLYDADKDFYFAARDHVGVCPLYMGHAKDGSVWFASEMKALQDQCVTFQDFPPGHVYCSDSGVKRWYEPEWLSTAERKLVPGAKLDLRELRDNLKAAVRRQLMTDVPYGVLLSGGLDSSLIAAIAARYAKDVIAWPQLHTFSVGWLG